MSQRYDRNIRAFGQDGQEALRKMKITIVGVGGLGMHVVQQLAYIGVGEITLIDSERLDITNLNRYVGARPEDVGTFKVDLGERIVNLINQDIGVRKVYDSFISREGYEAVKRANYVIGCLDKESMRLILNELCLAYEIPFFDLASEIIPGEHLTYGGRVCFISDSTGCLYCLGILDRSEASFELQDYATIKDLEKVYGVDKKDLGGSGPSVVSINGVVASLCVTEFMSMATKLRPPIRILNYYGDKGIIRLNKDQGDENCYYCKTIRGLRDSAGLEKYL